VVSDIIDRNTSIFLNNIPCHVFYTIKQEISDCTEITCPSFAIIDRWVNIEEESSCIICVQTQIVYAVRCLVSVQQESRFQLFSLHSRTFELGESLLIRFKLFNSTGDRPVDVLILRDQVLFISVCYRNTRWLFTDATLLFASGYRNPLRFGIEY